jgi:hypothetical protein
MAIAHHHDPDAPGAGLLASIVHVANAIVHALDVSREEDDLAPALSPAAWTAMGLNEEAWLHVFRETELQFEEITLILMG